MRLTPGTPRRPLSPRAGLEKLPPVSPSYGLSLSSSTQRGTGPGDPLSGYLSPGLAHLCVPSSMSQSECSHHQLREVVRGHFEGVLRGETLLWKFTAKRGVMGSSVSPTMLRS